MTTTAGVDLRGAAAVCRDAVTTGAALGVYLHVRHGGEVVADDAFGEVEPGVPAATGDVGELRCAVKPLTALCIGRAIEDGLLSLDDTLARWAPAGTSERVAALSVRQLLTHRSGLPNRVGPRVYEVGFDEYVARILTARFPSLAWDHQPIYSLARGWHLLAWVVQRVYGRPVEDVIAELVTRPLGLSTVDLLDRRGSSRPFQRRTPDGGYTAVRDTDAGTFGTRTNPAFGGFGSTGDLARLYEYLGACLADDGLVRRDTMRLLVCPSTGVRFGPTDPVLPYGHGLFLGGAAAGFGPEWEADCFGHMGSIGRFYGTVCLCAPSSATVVSARFTSIGRANNKLLASLGRAVRRDLALPRSPVDDRRIA